MEFGVVKFYEAGRGFGFIVPDDGGDDVFVHVTDLDGVELIRGDKVTFEVVDGSPGRGMKAINVSVKG